MAGGVTNANSVNQYGGGGGRAPGGKSTGGISSNSPIGQWLTSQGLAPTLRGGTAEDTKIAADWNKLPGLQQLQLIDQPMGGMSLYDALIMGGNNQQAMGNFATIGNYSTGFGRDPNNTRGPNIGSPFQGYSGQQGGPTAGGLFGPGGGPPPGAAGPPGTTPGGPGTTPPPVTPPPPGLNRTGGIGGGGQRGTLGTQQQSDANYGGVIPPNLPPQVMQAIMQMLQKSQA